MGSTPGLNLLANEITWEPCTQEPAEPEAQTMLTLGLEEDRRMPASRPGHLPCMGPSRTSHLSSHPLVSEIARRSGGVHAPPSGAQSGPAAAQAAERTSCTGWAGIQGDLAGSLLYIMASRPACCGLQSRLVTAFDHVGSGGSAELPAWQLSRQPSAQQPCNTCVRRM